MGKSKEEIVEEITNHLIKWASKNGKRYMSGLLKILKIVCLTDIKYKKQVEFGFLSPPTLLIVQEKLKNACLARILQEGQAEAMMILSMSMLKR